MKRLLVVIAVMAFLKTAVRAQTIQPVALITAKIGSGPGEFGANPGDDPDVLGPVVDDQERIYILSQLNNCLQSYDGTGKYLGCISIQSSLPPEALLREAGHTEPLVPDIISLGVVDGSVYALELLTGRKFHLFRLIGNKLINDDAELSRIDKKLGSGGDYGGRFKASLMRFGGTEKDLFAKYKLGNDVLRGIDWDSQNNMWIVTARAIRVYSPSGVLLKEIKAPVIWAGQTISKQGNLYVMAFEGTPVTGATDITVTKCSLRGK